MELLSPLWRRVLRPRRLTEASVKAVERRGSWRRTLTSSSGRTIFEEGDVVLLQQKADPGRDGILTKPLNSSTTIHTHRGIITHRSIIGTSSRDVISTSKGVEYRVQEPTLAEYVLNTPRLVTPIYPADAELVVSLLDIHVSQCSDVSKAPPRFEVLEAGTGHGALTLYLARALHAANGPLPTPPRSLLDEDNAEDPVYQGGSVEDIVETTMESWKGQRNALLHSLDVSRKHSAHARNIVKGFRRGMYFGNVDFHVENVSTWIENEFRARKSEDSFLSRVLLDLPSADSHLANVAPALKVDGMLAVFNPSITQILDCVEAIKKQNLPFWLDQVVELGAGSQARQWDIRAVRPRPTQAAREAQEDQISESQIVTETDPSPGVDQVETKDDNNWKMICRPRVWERVVGGGFLAIWRRMNSLN